MEKAKRKVISEYRPKAYYQTVGKFLLVPFTVVLAIYTLFGAIHATRIVEDWFVAFAMLVAGTLYGAIGWRAFYHAFKDRIVITPEGLLVEGWHNAFADWNSLAYFETQQLPGRNRDKVHGIHTTKPVSGCRSRVWFKYEFTNNFIPLSHVCQINHRVKWLELRTEFALDKFVETPLGQDLLHYAPHLFEEQKGKH